MAVQETGLAGVVAAVRGWRRQLSELAPVDRETALELRRELNLLAAEGARLCVGADAVEQATHANTTIGRARRDDALGRVMDGSDLVRTAVRSGRLSIDAAEKLGRVADRPGFAQALPKLVESGTHDTTGEFDRKVREFAAGTPAEVETERRRRYRLRQVKTWTDPDTGMSVGRWEMDKLEHDSIWRVVERVANSWGDDTRLPEQRRADALVEIVRAYAASELTGGRDTAHVLAHIEAEVLERRAKALGFTDLNEILTIDDIDRYAQAGLVSAYLTKGGVPIGVFAARRIASPELYRILSNTAGGCEVGACDRPAKACQTHHVVAWVWNPTTEVWELALFCSAHHTQAHKEKWVVWRERDGTLHVRRPDGYEIASTRSRMAVPELTATDPPIWGRLRAPATG